MLPLSLWKGSKNKEALEAPGPLCRPGNAQSFAFHIVEQPTRRKLNPVTGSQP